MSLKTILDDCFDAVGEKGVDVTGVIRSALPDAIRAITAVDGFEPTPELRQYTNIEQNFRSDALFTARLMIIPEATLPTVSVQVVGCNQINFGDGSGWQTIAQTSQTLNHTYTAFDAPVVIECVLTVASTIGGYACAILLKPSSVPTAIAYTPKFLWAVFSSQTIALKNSSSQIYIFNAGKNVYFQRLYIDCPATTALRYLTNNQSTDRYHVSKLTIPISLTAVGGVVTDFTSFLGDYRLPITLNLTAGNASINGPGTPDMTINGSGANVLMNLSSYTRNCPYPLSRLKIAANSVYGDWSYTFQNSPIEVIDMADCLYCGISNFTNNVNMSRLKSLLFPSYIDGNGVRQPRPLTGITSMGAIDISNSGLTRSAFVELFRSLPVNASAVICTITGSVGAADLTAEEIAIATSKNWIIVR